MDWFNRSVSLCINFVIYLCVGGGFSVVFYFVMALKYTSFSLPLSIILKHTTHTYKVTDDRINRLNSINFTWEMKRKPRKTTTNNTVKFDIMYEHLVSFKETYGHLKVNKMEKEWKKGIGAPKHKVFRRLPLFVAFVRKEQLAFVQGQPCSLDEEKIRLLTELGLEWRMPPSQPRKSTGGESTRKKRKQPPEEMLHHQVSEGVMDVDDDHHVMDDGSGYHYPPQEMMEGVEAAAAAAAAAHTFVPPPLAEPKTEETSEV